MANKCKEESRDEVILCDQNILGVRKWKKSEYYIFHKKMVSFSDDKTNQSNFVSMLKLTVPDQPVLYLKHHFNDRERYEHYRKEFVRKNILWIEYHKY